MPSSSPQLRGCLVAIVTPFRPDGSVDTDALTRHARWMVGEGVSGIVVNGTTGESATLTTDEKITAMNAVFDAVGDRATVVGGAGNNCTSESLEFVREANERARLHAIMSVVPYYNKPNQRGIARHFEAVADASRFPVVVYNVPGRTVVSMSVDTIVGVAAHPNIVGIKEASGDLHVAAKLVSRLPAEFALLSGDDPTAMPFIAVGGHGVISVAGNVAPRLVSDVCRAALESDYAAARPLNGRLALIHDLMFRYASPLPAKVVCEALGFGAAAVRLPLDGLDDAERESVLRDAVALGVLG
ncbi:MAG: 4-hydroxy-tetrahydrodipicolinate synthase [Myxococcales bacterium]|nr:4-hydroxy-tetrahydrodipicolinate synthase [Myxococcales bacterium]MCB9521159.1 4-hydroxy-tetrahydrodipicolinate synthase [Myxococcales bacterium]MCB9530517.1 4-hydroxy-tetrahydrodipicolinate synthase [Myxococcales bacterium]